MKRLSSRLTVLIKVLLFFKGVLFLGIAIFFVYFKDLVVTSISIIVSLLFLTFSKLLKSIEINENKIITSGLFSKKIYNLEDYQRVGDFLSLFYIQLRGKKVFFINRFRNELISITKSVEEAKQEIKSKIG